jgi:RNA polymerase sigma factor for flagellar operon FliA
MSQPTLSPADRTRLIEEHINLPHLLALHRVPREHPAFEDLEADGYVGLAEAADKYDPTHGASFKTFAWHRITGEMLDGARRLVRQARTDAPLRRRPEGSSPVDETPPCTPSWADADPAVRRRRPVIVNLDDADQDELAPRDIRDTTTSGDIEELLDRRRTLARVLGEIARLPQREKTIAHSHYFAGRTIQQTAATIGHSEFTTSRIHARMLRQLRKTLSPAVTQ